MRCRRRRTGCSGYCLATTLGAIGTNLASTLMIAYAPLELLPLDLPRDPLLLRAHAASGHRVLLLRRGRCGRGAAGRAGLRPGAAACRARRTSCWCWRTSPTGCLFYLRRGGRLPCRGPLIVSHLPRLLRLLRGLLRARLRLTRARHRPGHYERILAVLSRCIAVGVVIVIQQFFPTYILSGSAAVVLAAHRVSLPAKQAAYRSISSPASPTARNSRRCSALVDEKRQTPFTAVLVSLSITSSSSTTSSDHDNGDRIPARSFSSYLQTAGAHTLAVPIRRRPVRRPDRKLRRRRREPRRGRRDGHPDRPAAKAP